MPDDPFVRGFPSQARAAQVDELRLVWRDACADARLAYLTWRESAPAHAGEAFAAYVAAADREAAAANRYAGVPTGGVP
jgi:ATP phosphoribosyltransferase regulatory subunit HisZ